MSVTEIKAQCYDCLATIEMCQKKLQQLNQQLAEAYEKEKLAKEQTPKE